MNDLILYLTGGLCLFGAFFTLVAAIGVLRLDDLYMRLHAASKAGTLGAGAMLFALALFAQDASVTLRAIAGFVFLLLTAPISSHLLARAAYKVGYKPCALTHRDALAEAGAAERATIADESPNSDAAARR